MGRGLDLRPQGAVTCGCIKINPLLIKTTIFIIKVTHYCSNQQSFKTSHALQFAADVITICVYLQILQNAAALITKCVGWIYYKMQQPNYTMRTFF